MNLFEAIHKELNLITPDEMQIINSKKQKDYFLIIFQMIMKYGLN